MPASKASSDSMVTLSSPDPQRGVMDRKIKATVVFAVHFHYVVSLDSICFVTSHTVGTIESLCPTFHSGIYRTIELAGELNGKIIFTEVYFDAEKKDSALLGTQFPVAFVGCTYTIKYPTLCIPCSVWVVVNFFAQSLKLPEVCTPYPVQKFARLPNESAKWL
ncbi:hypothetical protein ARMSODRAFT_980922 [Armillaria solidipes]|uniref:Uncharacterized protein n=1 Tax=Armillaria solidipes TaxID=1076256 RepID=A0A2H3AZN3_9AGAR|nr:hypothetical protein ARMSODRAFT_980922 [Armillaria solidipes]